MVSVVVGVKEKLTFIYGFLCSKCSSKAMFLSLQYNQIPDISKYSKFSKSDKFIYRNYRVKLTVIIQTWLYYNVPCFIEHNLSYYSKTSLCFLICSIFDLPLTLVAVNAN